MTRLTSEEIKSKIEADHSLTKLFQEAVEASDRPLKKWEKLKGFFHEAVYTIKDIVKNPREQFKMAKDPAEIGNEFERKLKAGEVRILSKEEVAQRFAEINERRKETEKVVIMVHVAFALDDHPDKPFEAVVSKELNRLIARRQPKP